jgi:enoyl-CoA hydratase
VRSRPTTPSARSLTGAGDRAFSAGADIGSVAASIAGGVEQALREVVRRGQGLTRRIEQFPKPVIVAVNGLAYGGGCEITEAAPLAIASDKATFAKPEIALGFPPPFGGSQRLPRNIGRKRGLEMILTGDPIDAARAERIGLVNAVVPHAELLPAARALAERIIRHAPSAVTACLAAVTRGLNVPIDEGLAIEASWFAVTVPSQRVTDGLDQGIPKRLTAAPTATGVHRGRRTGAQTSPASCTQMAIWTRLVTSSLVKRRPMCAFTVGRDR